MLKYDGGLPVDNEPGDDGKGLNENEAGEVKKGGFYTLSLSYHLLSRCTGKQHARRQCEATGEGEIEEERSEHYLLLLDCISALSVSHSLRLTEMAISQGKNFNVMNHVSLKGFIGPCCC